MGGGIPPVDDILPVFVDFRSVSGEAHRTTKFLDRRRFEISKYVRVLLWHYPSRVKNRVITLGRPGPWPGPGYLELDPLVLPRADPVIGRPVIK